ncbi:hypothetical protein SAMN05216251_101339 [Actinacidiphila alni]|uniref:Uncharacterized protein n=1 Tax=Actinacidiphila alni TaxID=380248 RepID=A0A1I1XES0_9ACTN|nr:hypothetical protein SAMN05216251_101339 [Actinacidiphila alni]
MEVGGWQTGVWPSVKDNADLYMGTTAGSDAMSGFTIGVKAGTICQTVHVHSVGWMSKRCTTPGKWVYAGTNDLSLWTEAVRFTV